MVPSSKEEKNKQPNAKILIQLSLPIASAALRPFEFKKIKYIFFTGGPHNMNLRVGISIKGASRRHSNWRVKTFIIQRRSSDKHNNNNENEIINNCSILLLLLLRSKVDHRHRSAGRRNELEWNTRTLWRIASVSLYARFVWLHCRVFLRKKN